MTYKWKTTRGGVHSSCCTLNPWHSIIYESHVLSFEAVKSSWTHCKFRRMLLVRLKIQRDNVNLFPQLAHILFFWPACPGCIDEGSRYFSAMACVSAVTRVGTGDTEAILYCMCVMSLTVKAKEAGWPKQVPYQKTKGVHMRINWSTANLFTVYFSYIMR